MLGRKEKGEIIKESRIPPTFRTKIEELLNVKRVYAKPIIQKELNFQFKAPNDNAFSDSQ